MPDSPISRTGIPSPADPGIADAVARWVAAGDDGDQAKTLAAVVGRVAAARGVDVALHIDGAVVEPAPAVSAVAVDEGVCRAAGPWLPGFVREALLAEPVRRHRGVHHTSPEVADAIVDLAVASLGSAPAPVVADPAVGGGAFLLAAAARLRGSPAEVLSRLVGCDIDPLAVAVTGAALELWAGGAAMPPGSLIVGDFLADTVELVRPPDLVVGNPPFLSQLRGDAVRSAEQRTALQARWPEVGGYVDDAAAFLLASVDAVVDGGVVALLQPTSFLSARDAMGVRARLAARAPLVALWIDGGRRFAAAVDTVGVIVRRDGPSADVARAVGVPPTRLAPSPPPDPRSWAPLLADAAGVPVIDAAPMPTAARLGDVATVTSGFRDEFYGLRPAVSEDPEGRLRLVTSGLIDPLRLEWGHRSCRFDRRRWLHPVVDQGAVDASVADWVAARLVPKVLVATQTRVLEVVVDPDGRLVPCTPVVSVEPRAHAPSLWHLAAALTSPVAAAFVVSRAAGSALSPDAVRVSAPLLAEVPLPPVGPAWDAAADVARRAHVRRDHGAVLEVGRSALGAYGMADRRDLYEWWQRRLPSTQRG